MHDTIIDDYELYSVATLIRKAKKKVKSIKMNNPGAIARFVRKEYNMDEEFRELVVCVYIDRSSHMAYHKLISIGIIDQSLIHPREVFTSAISTNSTAMVVIHNHPSGNSAISREDSSVAERLFTVGKIVGIEMIDFIIIPRNGDPISFAEDGIISNYKTKYRDYESSLGILLNT